MAREDLLDPTEWAGAITVDLILESTPTFVSLGGLETVLIMAPSERVFVHIGAAGEIIADWRSTNAHFAEDTLCPPCAQGFSHTFVGVAVWSSVWIDGTSVTKA